MKKDNIILLPGLGRQVKYLLEKTYGQKFSNALIIGSASEIPAKKISAKLVCSTELIVEDYESLMNSKYALAEFPNINIKMMSFESTDYPNSSFDLIYAQASISLANRNKIVKEIKRILKPGGIFCVGEIVSLEKEIPTFIQNIYDSSNLLPIYAGELEKYYTQRNFSVEAKLELTHTLKEFYSQSYESYKKIESGLDEHEKSFYKKIINKIKHESNSYLKLGGDKFIGFIVLLLKKEEV